MGKLSHESERVRVRIGERESGLIAGRRHTSSFPLTALRESGWCSSAGSGGVGGGVCRKDTGSRKLGYKMHFVCANISVTATANRAATESRVPDTPTRIRALLEPRKNQDCIRISHMSAEQHIIFAFVLGAWNWLKQPVLVSAKAPVHF